MKELSIEEKAQRYDESIKRANSIDVHEYGDIIEAIFPELKESEDERIRKAIIEIVKKDEERIGVNAHLKKIQWLEKQAEHAKFCDSIQVGDKVTRNQDGVLVNLSQLKRVAKPAEKQGKHDMGISEATKQKLKDSLNKALEKETPESCNEFLNEQSEQKTTEEYNITGVGSKNAQGKLGEMIKNLKPINEVLEQKSAWSEEDEEMLEDIRFNFEYNKEKMTDGLVEQYDKFFDKVKSLKPQLKQEWSEEDKNILNHIINDIEYLKEQGYCKNLCNEEIDWLKSLKDRHTWKPSDEQIDVIEAVINNRSFQRRHLDSLYADLKRLRKE